MPGGGCPGTSPAARQHLLGTDSPPALAPSGTGGRPPAGIAAALAPGTHRGIGRGTPRVAALGTDRGYWARDTPGCCAGGTLVALGDAHPGATLWWYPCDTG